MWKEVRKLTKSSKGRRTNPPVIDGLSNQVEITGMFSEKTQDLLNSNTNDSVRLDILSDINAFLTQDDRISCSISVSTVKEALSHLKLDRSDGTVLNSNHFICASSVLSTFLSKLFTALLQHGYVSKSLRDCIMQPIPKPGQDSSISDNYRSIALAPTLSKVLEWCILIQFHEAFTTSGLQFGFKPGVSTDLCTGLIKNVTAKYCYNGTPVYGCFLDASKAFDRVNHTLLFKKLLQRNIPPIVVRTLLKWYTDQNISVLWNNTTSETFSIFKRCSTRWSSFANSLYGLHGRASSPTGATGSWMLLEASFCWCCLLRGRHCPSCTFTICSEANAQDVYPLC